MKKINFKVIFIIASSILIQSLFYLLAKFTIFEPFVLTSFIDRRLPFVGEFVYLYYLWYILIFLIPYIVYLKNKSSFIEYITVFGICILGAFLVFAFFPTTLIRPVVEVKDLTSFLTQLVYLIDTPVLNCLPSMHCVLCFMFIAYIWPLKDLKWYYKVLVTLTSILIVLSTMFIKQHVIWDAIAALFLVIISIIIVRKSKLNICLEKLLQKIKLI